MFKYLAQYVSQQAFENLDFVNQTVSYKFVEFLIFLAEKDDIFNLWSA